MRMHSWFSLPVLAFALAGAVHAQGGAAPGTAPDANSPAAQAGRGMDNPPPSVTPAPAAKGGLGTPGAAKPEGKAKDDCGAGGSSMKAQKEGCASGAKARAETG